jgi:predicted transcriptional regulator of viral defense system
MATVFDVNSFARQLQDVLRIEMEKAVIVATEEVLQRTREVVRAKLGEIAVRLFDQYSMERMGRDLVITVKLEPPPIR